MIDGLIETELEQSLEAACRFIRSPHAPHNPSGSVQRLVKETVLRIELERLAGRYGDVLEDYCDEGEGL